MVVVVDVVGVVVACGCVLLSVVGVVVACCWLLPAVMLYVFVVRLCIVEFVIGCGSLW